MNTATDAPNTLSSRALQSVQTLRPGYFALTMASGIILVGLELEGFHALSAAFLAVRGLLRSDPGAQPRPPGQVPAEMRHDFIGPRAGRLTSSPSGIECARRAARHGMAGWPGSDGGTPRSCGARLGGGATVRGRTPARGHHCSPGSPSRRRPAPTCPWLPASLSPLGRSATISRRSAAPPSPPRTSARTAPSSRPPCSPPTWHQVSSAASGLASPPPAT